MKTHQGQMIGSWMEGGHFSFSGKKGKNKTVRPFEKTGLSVLWSGNLKLGTIP
jgi:hypothetical protein